MSKVISFEQVYDHAAGIDIGSEKIFVSIDGEAVVNFGTTTSDYRECIGYLRRNGVKFVAIEATGIYWIVLYTMLEDAAIRVSLVNPQQTQQKRGDKTDVKDARRIQKLFAAGLLRESFIPEGRLFEIRMLVRERIDIIEMGSTYVKKMQKCLELMNIKLTEVISQIHGASRIRMIEAIIAGQRDGQHLLLLCDERIKAKKADAVLKGLEGNYNDTWIFLLEQNLQLWRKQQQQLCTIDARIELLLLDLVKEKDVIEESALSKAKPIRHHKPSIKNLHEIMVRILGVDASSLSGGNDYTLLIMIGETGTDMDRFSSVKSFTSWCGLSPGHHQSGKQRKWIKKAPCNKAGQIFLQVAQSLENSKKVAIGAFIRRLKSRRGPKVAYKAGARKIAEAFYNLLTKGKEYVEQGAVNYQQKMKERELLLVRKLAQKHKLQVIEN